MVRRIASVAILVLVVSALAASAGAQQPVKLNIATGKMFEGAPVNWGETTCIGGYWLGFYPLMCSPGTTRILLRNAITGWYITDVAGPAAPYLPSNVVPDGYPKPAGPAMFGLNCNLDAATMQGDCWGTLEIPAPGGSWEGTWSGKFDLLNYVAKISITAHGTGALEGRELKIDGMGPASGADFYFLAEIVNR